MQTTHILLIEDNPGDVRLIAEQLKEDTSSHYDLHSEGRLKAGLGYLAKAKVDLILLDLSLPDSQGFDTFSKTIACAPQTPIVILTGLADDALAIKAVQAGAQDYLTKGQISGDLLVRTIRYAIERKQAAENLRKKDEHHKAVIENIFKFVPEGLLVFTKNLNLMKQNKAFEDIVQKYAERLGYTEEELAGKIIEQVRGKILDGDTTEIHIPRIDQ